MRSAKIGGMLGLAGLLVVLAGGCGKLPPTHYYVLEAADMHPTATAAGGLEIGVRAFRVDAPYDQDRIVYRVGADSPEIGFYAYHRWAAPLSRMLPGIVSDGLAGIAGVRSIEPVMPGRRYGAYLDGRVLVFEEIDLPGEQQVRARLTLRLTDADGAELWSGGLDVSGSTNADAVRVVVERMNELLGEALVETRAALALALTEGG